MRHDDLAWQITMFDLDVVSIVRLSSLSRQLRHVCRKEQVWCVLMQKDFPEHVGLAGGKYREWYQDLYRFGAYYSSQNIKVTIRQHPICLLQPGEPDNLTVITYRGKLIYGSAPGGWALRHAGDRYLYSDEMEDKFLTHGVTLRSFDMRGETHYASSYALNISKFGAPYGTLAPYPHRKAIAKGLDWILEHFEVLFVNVHVPSIVQTGSSDPFCIEFKGWLRRGNVLTVSEQKTPFSYDKNYEGDWCHFWNEETERYCEEPVNCQYWDFCAKHPPAPAEIDLVAITGETDRHITQEGLLKTYYLRSCYVAKNFDEGTAGYSTMNGKLIPTFL